MNRVVLVICASVMLAVACGDGSGPSGPGGGQDYFPLEVGNSWQMVRNGSGHMGEVDYLVSGAFTITVTRTVQHELGFDLVEVVTAGQDTLFFEMTTVPMPPYAEYEYFRLTADSLAGYADSVEADPLYVIPLPIEVGDTWMVNEDPEIWAEAVSLTETVMVPAGTFSDCLHVVMEWNPDSASTDTANQYFAPGLGYVHNEQAMVDSSTGSWQETEDDLTDYTIL